MSWMNSGGAWTEDRSAGATSLPQENISSLDSGSLTHSSVFSNSLASIKSESISPTEAASTSAAAAGYADTSFGNQSEINYSMLTNFNTSASSFNHESMQTSLNSTKYEKNNELLYSFEKSIDTGSLPFQNENDKENRFIPTLKREFLSSPFKGKETFQSCVGVCR